MNERAQKLMSRIKALTEKWSSTSLSSSFYNDEINGVLKEVSEKYKDSTAVRTLKKVDTELTKLKKQLDPTPNREAIAELEKKLSILEEVFLAAIATRVEELEELMAKTNEATTADSSQKVSEVNRKLEDLKRELGSSDSTHVETQGNIRQEIQALRTELGVLKNKKLPTIPDLSKEVLRLTDELSRLSIEIPESITQTRTELLSQIVGHRGGNANRQINVTSSVMSDRYTDVNFTNSASIGWTATDDNTNKRVNISASVLTGGATGLARSVSVLSVSSTLAAAAATDYVFFANVGVRLTLPTAISNSNLYTVKNMATSSVQVAAAAGQDIDGSATVLLPTQYESLTFISNSSVWGVV